VNDWQVHLEFEEGSSSKFWRARVEGKTLYVNYGKIGANGQTQVKDFASPDLATKELDKLVREKRKKGYVDAGGDAGGVQGPDDEDAEDADDNDGDEGDDDDDAPARKPSGLAALAAASAQASARAPGIKLVLDSDGRKAETRIVLEGKTVRMDALETYESPEAAKQAHDRLKKALIGQGYRES
jgi:predicted DNA-binding WGR domain protein